MVLVLLMLLLSSIAAPIGLIGVVIYLGGMWLYNLKLKGKSYAEKPWMFLAAGAVTTIVLVLIFVEPAPEETSSDLKSEQQAQKAEEEKDQAEKEQEKQKAKELAEKQAKEEAEEKAKLAAEAKAKEEAELAKVKAEQEAKAKEAARISNLGLEAVTISRVVDGDTIETADGRKIRLIGVNTPESTTKKETFGKEASEYTASKLDGKEVWMQKDVSETDRYGRQLRIIWLEIPADDMNEDEIRSKMFNADLVLNGFAEPSTYPPDVKYSELFAKFSREARESGTGLWAFDPNGTTKGDLDPKAAATESKPAATTTAPAASTPALASSSETEFFANCTELRTKYPDGVPSTHAAYQPKMDRDKDNYACER